MALNFRSTARHRGWLLTLLMLYFTFLGGNSITDHSLGPRMVHHALMTVLMGGWLLWLLIKRRPWPTTPIDVPLAAFFAVNVLATIFAIDPRISLEEMWRLLTHIILFYIIVDLIRATRPRTIIEPLLFASAVVILIGFMEFVSWYAGIPRLQLFALSWLDVGGLQHPIPPIIYRLSFTLLIATHLSAYMAILIPIGLGWAISTHSRDTRRALILWLIGAVIIQVLSFSRGGLLSLAVSLPITAALSCFGSTAFRARLPLLIRNWRVIAGVGSVLLLLAVFALIWTRQSNLSGHASGDVLRLDLWKTAWQIGLHNPILGVGPYGYGRAMRLYRNPDVTPDHFITPHNVPLLVWAESGVLGVIALAVMTGTMFWTGWRRWQLASKHERIRVAAAFGALIGFSVQSLFDTFTNTTPIMLPAIILTAYLIYPFYAKQVKHPLFRQWLSAGALLVVLAAAVGWRISDRAQRHFETAIGLRDSDQREDALSEIDNAIQLDPHIGLYAAQRAQILGEMALEDEQYLPEAVAAYEKALSLEDSYDLMLTNYGVMLVMSGELESALEQFLRASAIRPKDPYYHLLVAETAAQIGRTHVAEDEYFEMLDVSPEWVVSPFWDESPERASVRDAYVSQQDWADLPYRVVSNLPVSCWSMISSPSEFRAEESSYTIGFCEARITLDVEDDPEQALRLLDRHLRVFPADNLYAFRAEAQLRLGNIDGANLDARMALFLGDSRAHFILGLIAEQEGNVETAISEYQQAVPVIYQLRGWDVAAYNRLGSLFLLDPGEFDAPGRSRYDLAPLISLYHLYESMGQPDDAQNVLNAIRELDPFFELD